MGREVRRVPKDWQHPKNRHGKYTPLLGDSFSERKAAWMEGAVKWDEGLRLEYFTNRWIPKDPDMNYSYERWEGTCPEESEYMPDWPDEERTHLQMYETCTEGTPISPVMKTPEELARWLTDNNASAFGYMTATYEQWLATARAGWAPSAVLDNRGFRSGVAIMAETVILPPRWKMALATAIMLLPLLAVLWS